ncbi:MAG: NAD+ synthase [Sedimentisphaerales bacterium]|nr:NAD+ synthase [Sedimentisphaerales bacterium]
MRLALAQFNAVVGDLDGNIHQMHLFWQQAVEHGADLILFPELAICGYPPEDLVFSRQFLTDCRKALDQLAKYCDHKTIVVGFPQWTDGQIYNAAAVITDGKIKAIYRKGRLPNFAVFDESRYFRPGSEPVVIEVDGMRAAVTICFDIWDLGWLAGTLRPIGPIGLILNISASPFDLGKQARRQAVVLRAARYFDCPVALCNLVGGQDELVFDGRSMVANPDGTVVTLGKAFDQDLQLVDVLQEGRHHIARPVTEPAPDISDAMEEVYLALALGTRDYITKNHFQQALVGVSGGIDSALTVAIAAKAIGPTNVWAVSMPSRFNSPETIADARQVAENVGVRFISIPIDPILDTFDRQLAMVKGWNDQGVAYENLQARIRGTILMSLSNQFGALVLVTGNNSEVSSGYCTLYGDTAGGLAVLKDVPKTMVYQLARFINTRAGRPLIPETTITRTPSAELRHGQTDQQTLPPYPVLDQIISKYVEQDLAPGQIIASGIPSAIVHKVVRMIDRSEYKRRQSPIGIRITTKAFGKDRRLPITNRYDPCRQ